jgi:hypothetical protein
MGFRYSYKADDIRRRISYFSHYNGKQALAAIVFVVVVFSLYMFSSRITGYVTYSGSLEDVLNKTRADLFQVNVAGEECRQTLSTTNGNLEMCMNKLGDSASYLVECEAKRDELQSYSDQLNTQLSASEGERASWKESYENKSADYSSLARNYARMCCSAFDIVNSKTINWDLTSNMVTCDSGSYTVNCATGETNY